MSTLGTARSSEPISPGTEAFGEALDFSAQGDWTGRSKFERRIELDEIDGRLRELALSAFTRFAKDGELYSFIMTQTRCIRNASVHIWKFVLPLAIPELQSLAFHRTNKRKIDRSALKHYGQR